MTRPLWIASYPKSGNTWVRFILTNLLHGPVESSGEIDAFIPGVHKTRRGALVPVYRDAMFLKTHYVASQIGDLGRSAGAIYVLRNPLDLYCSCLHYTRIEDGQRPIALRRFIANGGVADWVARGIGNLRQNVASWTQPRLKLPRLLLRYEDLSSSPLAAVAELCRFLGIAASAEQMASAVERSSFASLRALEEREIAANSAGFFATERGEERAAAARWRFMNRGRVGGYRQALSMAEIEMLARAFAGVMAEAGYALDAAGDLVVAADYPALARLPAATAF